MDRAGMAAAKTILAGWGAAAAQADPTQTIMRGRVGLRGERKPRAAVSDGLFAVVDVVVSAMPETRRQVAVRVFQMQQPGDVVCDALGLNRSELAEHLTCLKAAVLGGLAVAAALRGRGG